MATLPLSHTLSLVLAPARGITVLFYYQTQNKTKKLHFPISLAAGSDHSMPFWSSRCTGMMSLEGLQEIQVTPNIWHPLPFTDPFICLENSLVSAVGVLPQDSPDFIYLSHHVKTSQS